jgi:mannose-6-phosphate isomerase-like protein (cupin superfamily)
MTKGFHKIFLEKETIKNKNYRRVIHTDKFQQIVLMSLEPGEFIHNEKHSATQFFRVESGNGYAEIDGQKILLKDGVSLSVMPETYHKIVNSSKIPLKLYTIYSPPMHGENEIDKRQP